MDQRLLLLGLFRVAREEGIGLLPLEFCLFFLQGKCPRELLMTRHFSILTAVCEMLMGFLANKTRLDPSLSIARSFPPNFNLEESWRDFIKKLV